MTQRLIIYLDETWPAEPSAPWVLLDARDRVVQQGRSEPAHWPAAADCEIVLGGAQCAWFETRLPKTARREQERLLRYALETQLLQDVDAQHLAPTHFRPDDQGVIAGVLVVARARLRTVLAQLAAIGRAPTRATAELQGVPHAASRWTLALGPTGGAVLRLDAHHAFAVDRGLIADVVGHALLQLGPDERRPEGVEVRASSAGDPAGSIDAFPDGLGLPCETGAPYPWWEASAAGTDLLIGEFAPSHRGAAGRRALRRPLALAAAAMVVFVAANLVAVLWQRHQLGGIEERMQRLFVTAVPGTPAIAPALQLRRHLDEARAQRGELREDDLLALLAAYSEIRGSAAGRSVRSLAFEAGRLKLALDPASAHELDAVAARFAALGYLAQADRTGSPVLTISRRTQP